MKEIIALQEYTDKYISLYEGEIRNIAQPLAIKLIEQGIVAEHDTINNGGSGMVVKMKAAQQDFAIFDKTYNEVVDIIKKGTLPILENPQLPGVIFVPAGYENNKIVFNGAQMALILTSNSPDQSLYCKIAELSQGSNSGSGSGSGGGNL